jgi:hypothetical protein
MGVEYALKEHEVPADYDNTFLCEVKNWVMKLPDNPSQEVKLRMRFQRLNHKQAGPANRRTDCET